MEVSVFLLEPPGSLELNLYFWFNSLVPLGLHNCILILLSPPVCLCLHLLIWFHVFLLCFICFIFISLFYCMSLPWAASNICETDGIWIKDIGMFEKVVIDKADEDENSVLVLRKCWCLWYLVSLSPWSSCLPNGSILVTSTPLSLSVALAASQARVFPTLSPLSPEFTDTCPYFWLPSYQMAPSECPTGPSAQHVPSEALISKNPQTCLCLDSSGTTIYPIAPISHLCSLFTFYIP